MKIKRIKFENHPILKNLELDFSDENGNIADTIYIAGENGTGKSTILNILYNILKRNIAEGFFEIEFYSDDKDKRRIENNLCNLNNSYSFLLSEPYRSLFQEKIFTFSDINGQLAFRKDNVSFYYGHLNEVFKNKVIFSDTEINFTTSSIISVTSKTLDDNKNNEFKSTSNLAKEITQLLIDIQSQDDSEMGLWNRENIGKSIPEELIDRRIKRFTKAFETMFPNKKYGGIKVIDNQHKITFKENGQDILLDNFSSGEKQIVFRGGFLLKDKGSLDSAFVLIDEPEISLHPEWQKKISDFYKNIFTYEQGEQTSQIFMVTHSPFILHNKNRKNDKVIILKKDENGDITADGESFYSCEEEKVIEKAFNINFYREEIEKIASGKDHIIITEGKTDWKHIVSAFKILSSVDENKYNFHKYDEKTEMGDRRLLKLCEDASIKPNPRKEIFIFDCDVPLTARDVTTDNKKFKDWGNNVYSFTIPKPSHRDFSNISIEHYYKDEEIKTEDEFGHRLYIENEFSPNSKIHHDKKKNYSGHSKIDVQGAKIFEDSVFCIDSDSNVALPKNKFADYILEGKDNFKDFNRQEFKLIAEVLDEILALPIK